MHRDASWCAVMRPMLWQSTANVMYRILWENSANWTNLHACDASWCAVMHHDASWCVPCCGKALKHLYACDASWCAVMRHDAPWCIVMRGDAPWCALDQVYSTTLTLFMCWSNLIPNDLSCLWKWYLVCLCLPAAGATHAPQQDQMFRNGESLHDASYKFYYILYWNDLICLSVCDSNGPWGHGSARFK